MRNFFYILVLVLAISCASTKKQPDIITFSPLNVSREMLDKKDFSEVITVVNSQFDGGRHSYNRVEVVREEAVYLTLKLTSNISADGCCKVSVDKNRAAIVSMRPDCPIDVEE
ncbi:MAG TPA: hypothetical protein VHO70_24400 [Chitinispirillaceae bacterium]|nr:hypothetical protein [Chitinispirillaceae bacterium]